MRKIAGNLTALGQGQRLLAERIEVIFPVLRTVPYRVTSPATDGYNCIAWAAGEGRKGGGNFSHSRGRGNLTIRTEYSDQEATVQKTFFPTPSSGSLRHRPFSADRTDSRFLNPASVISVSLREMVQSRVREASCFSPSSVTCVPDKSRSCRPRRRAREARPWSVTAQPASAQGSRVSE